MKLYIGNFHGRIGPPRANIIERLKGSNACKYNMAAPEVGDTRVELEIDGARAEATLGWKLQGPLPSLLQDQPRHTYLPRHLPRTKHRDLAAP